VPVGSASGAAINWGGNNVAGTGEVNGLDIYGAPVNLNFSPRGCLAAIGGQEHMRIVNSHLHNNAWGFAINSPDWYVAGNELDHNGAGDGSAGGHCQGFANGNIKVIHHADFYNNFIHDNTVTGIWYDVGNATSGGEVAYNTFANNGAQGDVTYEISWGGLDSHDNVHLGGRAYDIESSANVRVHDDDFGDASVLLGYGPRALPDSECKQYTTAKCRGTMPHDISLDHNTGISEVVTEPWLRSTHSIHDTTWSPNGCQLPDPDGNVIPSVTCTDNTNVEFSISSMSRWIEKYAASNDLHGPLVPQLDNSLKQAQQKLDKGLDDQAVKHMEDFLKHLDNIALENNISASTKAVLKWDAVYLIKLWSGK
jgi:hypothetical protein